MESSKKVTESVNRLLKPWNLPQKDINHLRQQFTVLVSLIHSEPKRRTEKQIVTEAVRNLYDYGFISQFERDSFYKRFETIKK